MRLLMHFLGIWLLLTGFLGGPMAARAGTPLTLAEVENRLVHGGYIETLQNAYWAVDQGAAIVPLLARMLHKRGDYDRELGGATGAFPYNALWVLGHIPQSAALRTLQDYWAASGDPSAALAIKGWKLRARKKGPGCGVLTREAPLLAQPAARVRVVKSLQPGKWSRSSAP
jgi:hypothetical protein